LNELLVLEKDAGNSRQTPHIRFVDTRVVINKDELMKHHDKWVAEGYEGLIARVLSAPYEYGHRSPSLLKVKQFDDSEFMIIGATHGEGIEQDLVIWECKNDTNDLTFETRPRGTHAERRDLLSNAESFMGASLKCLFFGRTELGLPRFPIGIAIRAEEDIS
jgi:DNA ligase-1